MAKRYFTPEQISKFEIGQKVHAPNVFGNHHLVVLDRNETHTLIKGVESNGSAKEIWHKNDRTLGYDCGQIWSIRNAMEIKDPIVRFFREHQLSKDLISWHQPGEKIFIHKKEYSYLYNQQVEHDGSVGEDPDPYFGSVDKYKDGTPPLYMSNKIHAYTPKGYAIKVEHRFDNRRTYLQEVHLVKGVDPEAVIKVLKKILKITTSELAD